MKHLSGALALETKTISKLQLETTAKDKNKEIQKKAKDYQKAPSMCDLACALILLEKTESKSSLCFNYKSTLFFSMALSGVH